MRRLLNVILALALTVVMMLAFTACKENNNQTKDELAGWEYIEDKGELVIGLDDTFAPMGFRDESGDLVGFDIDLANAVGKELGVKVRFNPIDWNAKEMELSSKRIDCIWNGMSATPERQKKMALTNKYLNNSIVILAKDDTVKVESAKDLANYKVATQVDSSALESMKANEDYSAFEKNVTEYRNYDEAILDMKAGRIDCIVVDQVLGEYKNSKMKDGEKMVLCDYKFSDDFYAIGCRVDEKDVAAKITEAIEKTIENGKAEEISNKWFGRNIVISEGYDD
ncbi:MAG: amino acid ABC transporter substrate-binding protein [Eubacteriales bacterium]